MKKKIVILVLVSLFSIPLIGSFHVRGIDTLSLDYPSSVMEGTQFIVTVTVQYSPVEGVLIRFSGQEEYTNQYGMAVLTAPAVDHSTRFYFSAEKDGYTCPMTDINIEDTGDVSEEQLLTVTAPSSVIENDYFKIQVSNNHDDGVAGATVIIEWSDFQADTDVTGSVNLTAPSVETTTEYAIMVTASGYLPNTEMVEVIKKPQLEIDAPPTVYAGDSFTVTITANSNPVSGALVSFNNRGTLTNASGQVQFISPQIETVLGSNTYLITASKTNYLSAEAWIIVLKQGGIIPMGPQQLLINAPSSVIEGGTVLVMITDNRTGDPIDDATVQFANTQYGTDEDGIVTIPAPLVEHNTSYTLVATKEGWQSDTAPIMVLNEENHLPTQVIGWISGRVTDTAGSDLSDVQVCAIGSTGDTCVSSTNEQGRYMFTVTPGSYSVVARQEEYVTSTASAIVQKNTIFTVNFILEKEKKEMIDYALQWLINEEGLVGGEVQISEEEPENITIYNEMLTIDVVAVTPGSFTFRVTGPDGTEGTVFLFRIQNTDALLQQKVSDLNEIRVFFDGKEIEMASDFPSIFSSSISDGNPAWAGVVTKDNVYVMVCTTHFSEHEIMITFGAITEALSGVIAIGWYVAICVLLALFIVIPIFFIEKQ